MCLLKFEEWFGVGGGWVGVGGAELKDRKTYWEAEAVSEVEVKEGWMGVEKEQWNPCPCWSDWRWLSQPSALLLQAALLEAGAVQVEVLPDRSEGDWVTLGERMKSILCDLWLEVY